MELLNYLIYYYPHRNINDNYMFFCQKLYDREFVWKKY